MRSSDRSNVLQRRFEWLLAVWLLACAATFLAASIHWPLAGDVSYMHYVVFLMRHGMVPYRDIIDMNLPGTYMVESATIALLGPESGGWRAFDFLLMTAACAAILAILRPYGKAAGIFALSLFLLVHGQDGVIMSGQRDFLVAVLLLCGLAFLFAALRGLQPEWIAFTSSGACLGIASAVKPTAIAVVAGLALWTGVTLHKRGERFVNALATLLAGICLPLLATLLFLWTHHGVAAFWQALHGLIPYHASLGHKSASFLIGHSLSPLLPLFLIWIAAAAASRISSSGPPSSSEVIEYGALLLSAAGGLFSYLIQQKGFSYQRYPFLSFLLPVMSIDLFRLARTRSPTRALGTAGLLCGAVLAGIFAARTLRFDSGPPAHPLLDDLNQLGAAERQVQCMDTAGSCIADLRAGKLVQSTGFLYDCYLLDGENTIALDLRRRFWQQVDLNPPRLIVVTDSMCFDPVPTFEKYRKWPEFETYLAKNYTLTRVSGRQEPVRYWSRSVKPFDYRIYVRH